MHAYYILIYSIKFGMIKQKARLSRAGFKMVVLSGLEPPTHGFSVRCSTN